MSRILDKQILREKIHRLQNYSRSCGLPTYEEALSLLSDAIDVVLALVEEVKEIQK